jgi:hypothetical protein
MIDLGYVLLIKKDGDWEAVQGPQGPIIRATASAVEKHLQAPFFGKKGDIYAIAPVNDLKKMTFYLDKKAVTMDTLVAALLELDKNAARWLSFGDFHKFRTELRAIGNGGQLPLTVDALLDLLAKLDTLFLNPIYLKLYIDGSGSVWVCRVGNDEEIASFVSAGTMEKALKDAIKKYETPF